MDTDDFQRLASRYRDRVFNLAFYSLRHRQDAEDVTQEVLVRLWHHRTKLDASLLGAWVVKVTRNACYDLLRRHKVRRSHFAPMPRDAEGEVAVLPCDAPSPQRRAEGSDFRRRLEAALRDLGEPYRSVLVLREIEGLKYDEIAAALDKPLNSVKVYLHRGRKMLRQRLREHDPRRGGDWEDCGAEAANREAAHA